MVQANVFTSVNSLAWYTDKARISTGDSAVTYQVNVLYPVAAGDLYSVPVQIPPASTRDVFVGVGNQLTVTGTGFTALEVGIASSGIQSVRQL